MGYVQIRPWAGMDQDSGLLGSPSLVAPKGKGAQDQGPTVSQEELRFGGRVNH